VEERASQSQSATGAQRVVPMSELPSLAGQRLGTSRWRPVTQEMINSFADTTDDHQWLHVDPERAASGPFGSTIAHGYLTLSLATALLWDVLEVPDAARIVNYGVGKVRFPAPLPAGSQVRAHVDVAAVEEVKGGLQLTTVLTYERDGGDRPVCVAELLFRYYA
jgi:acyl dehydratase